MGLGLVVVLLPARCISSSMARAASRSAVVLDWVAQAATTSPLRFSMITCPR